MTEKQQQVLAKAYDIFGTDKMSDKIGQIESILKNTPDIERVDYTDQMVRDLLNDVIYNKQEENLFTRYIIPPFSYLDTKQGEWQKRKQKLDDYFGSSVVGRKDGLAYGDLKVRKDDNGTSQFDSALCEIIYKWFAFKECRVYDCFAGGHIRGTMAALLGYRYFGIELATEQVESNKIRAEELGLKPIWVNDDSLNVDKYIKDDYVDLLFSCPPYGDLEKYTDDPRDLSNMEYDKFLAAYNEIIKKGVAKLKNNRFAVFVVGDFRDKQGFYRGFVKDTIIAFENAGAKLYNEMILLNNIGTAPMRANNTMSSRKVVKLHQNILVFFKGDPSTIKDTYGDVDGKLPIKEAKQDTLL